MSVASSATTHNHTIRYQLQVEAEQVKLRLWEPPIAIAAASTQALPYLYLANFTFETMVEAEAYLRNHLLENGAFDVPENHFPPEGAIAILPFPTWNLES